VIYRIQLVHLIWATVCWRNRSTTTCSNEQSLHWCCLSESHQETCGRTLQQSRSFSDSYKEKQLSDDPLLRILLDHQTKHSCTSWAGPENRSLVVPFFTKCMSLTLYNAYIAPAHPSCVHTRRRSRRRLKCSLCQYSCCLLHFGKKHSPVNLF